MSITENENDDDYSLDLAEEQADVSRSRLDPNPIPVDTSDGSEDLGDEEAEADFRKNFPDVQITDDGDA